MGIVRKIKLKCQNGITFKEALVDILFPITDYFDFENSDEPDFILFGPYGNDIPNPGRYVRIGYFCENITPDLSICEWAFGIPRNEDIMNNRYRRICWHGIHPDNLRKQLSDNDIDQIINSKKRFCNFIYTNRVHYREEFFRQLSKYKRIDAPGKSMNNMPSFDSHYAGNAWERKRKFISEYKFTIAFENYSYPGYQTEKLYDPMLAYSLPIYTGDPYVHTIFNTKSFINMPNYIRLGEHILVNWLEKVSQQNFRDIRPSFFHGLKDRIQRKVKSMGRQLKMNLQYNRLDFSDLIDRIVEIDKNPDLYYQYLKEPWLVNNQVHEQTLNRDRWIEIFTS